uniref:Uncharacterized protein n=1 Tax=Solanum lycopersicum TaxID=4081 RepID=A0A3Q7FNV6_SOLLC
MAQGSTQSSFFRDRERGLFQQRELERPLSHSLQDPKKRKNRKTWEAVRFSSRFAITVVETALAGLVNQTMIHLEGFLAVVGPTRYQPKSCRNVGSPPKIHSSVMAVGLA